MDMVSQLGHFYVLGIIILSCLSVLYLFISLIYMFVKISINYVNRIEDKDNIFEKSFLTGRILDRIVGDNKIRAIFFPEYQTIDLEILMIQETLVWMYLIILVVTFPLSIVAIIWISIVLVLSNTDDKRLMRNIMK